MYLCGDCDFRCLSELSANDHRFPNHEVTENSTYSGKMSDWLCDPRLIPVKNLDQEIKRRQEEIQNLMAEVTILQSRL